MSPSRVKQLVLAKLPLAHVEVQDMTGTGDHFEVLVAAKEFAGKSLVEQHKMVFAALESEMDKGIHAVKLKTKVLV